MSAEGKPAAPPPPTDPIQQMAHEIFVQMCGRIYSQGGEKPQPRAVAQIAFKLAETFQAANLEFNPVARAAREAKEKASVNLDAVQIDFSAPAKPK
jgi:hypothetical protein